MYIDRKAKKTETNKMKQGKYAVPLKGVKSNEMEWSSKMIWIVMKWNGVDVNGVKREWKWNGREGIDKE